jgi:hypothetical protein
MSKVRVYEVARELSLENNELMKRLATLGIQVRNHMSALDVAEIDRVKRAIEKDKVENTVETKLRAGVVRRRTVAQPKDEVVAEVRAPEPVAPPPPARVEPPPARVEPVVEIPREPEPPPPPTVPSAQKRIIRIEDQIQLQTLAQRMSLKATDVLMELIQQGVGNVHINSTLDADTATLLASSSATRSRT